MLNNVEFYITKYPGVSWQFIGKIHKVESDTRSNKRFKSIAEASYFLLTSRLSSFEWYISLNARNQPRGWYQGKTTITAEEYIRQVTLSQINPTKKKLQYLINHYPELLI